MKSLLLTFSVLLIAIAAYCQGHSGAIQLNADYPVHQFGEYSLSVSPDLLLKTPNGIQFAGGIKIRTYISKRISFDSDLVFGRDYVHGGPGIIGLPIWILFLN